MVVDTFERDPLICSICDGTSHRENCGQEDANLKTVSYVCFPCVLLARAIGPKLVSGAIFPIAKHS